MKHRLLLKTTQINGKAMKNRLTIFLYPVLISNLSCAINFELTSQRTALETQMLGKYDNANDELYMISSVRNLDDAASNPKSNTDIFKLAKQNQIFNKDDISEFKDLQIIGESEDGLIIMLPSNIGLVSKATPKQINLAEILIKEENHDRELIWQNTLQSNENLKPSDLDKVRKTYATQIFAEAKAGHWFHSSSKGWMQKIPNTNVQ